MYMHICNMYIAEVQHRSLFVTLGMSMSSGCRVQCSKRATRPNCKPLLILFVSAIGSTRHVTS